MHHNPSEIFDDETNDVKSNTNVLNLSNLLDYLQKLNDYLEREEEFDRNVRKIRRILFKHNILTNKLIPFYKYILTKLNSETQYEKLISTPHRLLDNHKELISSIKLIKNLNEILKALVDLTSPNEFLNLNHSFIFTILTRYDLIIKNRTGSIEIPNVLDEINRGISNTPEITQLIGENFEIFKEKLFKFEVINLTCESYKKLIEYYKSISSIYNNQKTINYSTSVLKHFKLLEKILLDSIILNLAFIRNFCVEKDQSRILDKLFELGLDDFLIELANLRNLNKHFFDNRKNEDKFFVTNCLIVQIVSLIFGKYQNLERNDSQSSLDSVDIANQFKTSNYNIKIFVIKFSQSDSFKILIQQMIRLLSKPLRIHAYFDISYFMWLLKFFISNFIKSDDKLENDGMSEKILFNYDLFSYIVFIILENFEKLIFDSNFKNMNLLRMYKLKNIGKNEQLVSDKVQEFKKVTNINNLKLLCLGIWCLNELLTCVNYYLDYLNTHKLYSTNLTNQNQDVQDFLMLINEMLNFEELKQLFPLLMRFYCYNQHVYSNSLVKSIFLTNQLYLNTYKHCHEIVRKIKYKELDKNSDYVFSDTNATKNSSLSDSASLTSQSLNISEIYNMYANTHTSYILKDVLANFVNNEPSLNRCVIDFLDSLMCQTDKHEYLFHMNFALALANIATLDNYHLLDQRTKDLVGNMLNGIRRLCRKRPNLANKILFNFESNNDNNDDFKNKRIKSELLSGSDVFIDSDSISVSKTSTTTSSWSSLKSDSTILSYSSSSEGKLKSDSDDENMDNIDSSPHLTELTKELKVLIENEFLFCLRSIETYDESKNLRDSTYWNGLIKNDHLIKIFSYLVDLFNSNSSNLSNDLKVNSWQIYNCLLEMKFSMADKINYLNALNNSSVTGKIFKLGINLGFSSMKNDFFKSNECISLREACNTEEFRKCLKEAYVKFLIGRLCVKTKKTRNAVFWVFNVFKSLKLYLTKKTFNVDKNTNDINQLNLTWNHFNKNTNFSSKFGISSMLFQMKLIGYYHSYGSGIPLIPFSYEQQQVFHSVDFSRLLDIFGLTRTNRGFPFVPNDWLDSNKQKLNECISLIEKCVCI